MTSIYKRFSAEFCGAGVLTFAALPAQAHTLEMHGSGLASGFIHPFAGADHVLVMLAVGALAVVRREPTSAALPATFVAVMVIGALVSLAGVSVPLTEPLILASLLAAGCLVAAGGRLPIWTSLGTVGFFGFFHGAAHGGEMPASADPLLFVTGFTLGTALLHGAGCMLAIAAFRAMPVRSASPLR